MKLSEKRQTELFNSVYEPLMDLRVKRSGHINEHLDTALFEVSLEIASRIKKALNLEE